MDRNEIVEIVSKFYNFLVTHSLLPASTIKTPPTEGWPEENRQTFRKMGKSEEVVDLLCHLPYISDAHWFWPDRDWRWLKETKAIDYTSPSNLMRIDGSYESTRYMFQPINQAIPPHVFSLTIGRLYGTWLLLDLQAGRFF